MAIVEIIQSVFGVQTNNGTCGRCERHKQMLARLIEKVEGNIVEIGCGVGQSSVLFLDVAKSYNRKFIAVDPWDTVYKSTGKPCDYKFSDFTSYVDIMSPNIVLCRMNSNEPDAIRTIQANAPIAFGFVDGDVFSTDAELMDMRTLAGCGTAVICVDDQAKDTVRAAINEFKKDWQYDEHMVDGLHETYLVRR